MSTVITDENGSSFLVGDYIDRGSFSKVFTLECCKTKKRLAGKFISKEKLIKYGILKSVWNEIEIHQLLRHDHIVQFLSYIEREKEIIIILEYCSKYSMASVLHTLKTLTLGESKYFMAQIVSAVEYLHSRKIVHRDLKLGNLFVNRKLEIKLGDFGLAVVIEFDGQKRFSRCGTPNYLAPEVINAVGHSFEVDIWALGCILYTMLEGTPPFQGQNTTSTYNNILKCSYSFSNRINLSAKEFINGCLQPDPYLRPSIFQLKCFDFLASKEIRQMPPKFAVVENELITFFRSREKVIEARPSKTVELQLGLNPEKNDYFYTCMVKILNSLRHVRDWQVSDFGEFLAEHKSSVPLVWVNSWMDYSNSYGFAYQLSNNNYGIVFNDETRMLYLFEKGLIHYTKRNEAVFVCQKDRVPESLKKKTKLLMICKNYMNEALKKAHEAQGTEQEQKGGSSPEVSVWFKGEREMVMLLTNGYMQVNFFEDHTKLIFSGLCNTVTIIENVDRTLMKTVKLEVLKNCGCSKSLRAKLCVAQKHLYQFLAGKNLLKSG